MNEMQKAPHMEGSPLKEPPQDSSKSNEKKEEEQEVHVFGKNLEQRVVTNNDDDEESPSISFDSNRTGQNIEDDDIESIRKRKFDAITGEEDEETIFQSDFKLFVWDLPTSNWIEKGRGQLRLNDSIDRNEKRSRLIMRVSGTLRIILNVAINRSFFKIIASSKNNIRFTDSQTVWAASGNNAHQLRDLIEERLKAMAEEEETENELRKKSKPNADERTPSKKTKADEDGEDLSSSRTSDSGDLAHTQVSSASEKEEVDDDDDGEEKPDLTEDDKSHESDEAGGDKHDDNPKDDHDAEGSDKNEGSENGSKVSDEGKGSDEDQGDEQVEAKKITKSVKKCEIKENGQEEESSPPDSERGIERR